MAFLIGCYIGYIFMLSQSTRNVNVFLIICLFPASAITLLNLLQKVYNMIKNCFKRTPKMKKLEKIGKKILMKERSGLKVTEAEQEAFADALAENILSFIEEYDPQDSPAKTKLFELTHAAFLEYDDCPFEKAVPFMANYLSDFLDNLYNKDPETFDMFYEDYDVLFSILNEKLRSYEEENKDITTWDYESLEYDCSIDEAIIIMKKCLSVISKAASGKSLLRKKILIYETNRLFALWRCIWTESFSIN